MRYEANLELFPAGPETEPLRTLKVGGEHPDPKDRLAHVFAGLRQGEYAEVQVSFRELTAAQASRLRRYWEETAAGSVDRGSLSEPETSRQGIGKVAGRSLGLSRLKDKLDPQNPLFEVQILLHASSEDPQRAVEIVLGLMTACTGRFNGANVLGVHGRKLPGLKFYATDSFSWSKWWHRYRRQTGLFWPARRARVAGFEGLVMAFCFPWAKHDSQAPLRTGGVVPPPPAGLPVIEEDEGSHEASA